MDGDMQRSGIRSPRQKCQPTLSECGAAIAGAAGSTPARTCESVARLEEHRAVNPAMRVRLRPELVCPAGESPHRRILWQR